MPRGRKTKYKGGIGTVGSNYECCSSGKGGKIIACGVVLVAIAAAIKYGVSLSDLLLLIGLVFIVKGVLMSALKK